METMELLHTRRSVKAADQADPGPDPQTLQRILQAAMRVPDHGKLVPWRFVVFAGDARVRFGQQVLGPAYAKANPDAAPAAIEMEAERFVRAPVVVGVVSSPKPGKIPEWEQWLSAGAACQTMLIATHASGFVGQWITEWYAYDPMVRAALGLADHERIAGWVYIGSPKAPPKERDRPLYDAVVQAWAG